MAIDTTAAGPVEHSGGPPSYRPPEIDVPAPAVFADDRHAEARSLVRSNLAEYASVLDEADTARDAAVPELLGS